MEMEKKKKSQPLCCTAITASLHPCFFFSSALPPPICCQENSTGQMQALHWIRPCTWDRPFGDGKTSSLKRRGRIELPPAERGLALSATG